VLDTGARGSTNTFVQRGIGDVLLAWENEAYLAVTESKGQVDLVTPPTSILTEPPVAVVDRIAAKRGTTAVAQAYLEYLGSPEGQEIAAKHHYRPRDPNVLKKYKSSFAEVKLFTIGDAFGGWPAASKTHFANGAIFDQIYQPGAR
jgi:sulfate transport system substrate-binding protein